MHASSLPRQAGSLQLRHWLAVLCLATSGPASAGVEWFAGPQPGEPQHGWSSHVGTRVQARGHQSKESCSFAAANPPQPLTAWFKQFGHCKPPPSPPLRGHPAMFDFDDSGYARWSDPASGREALLTSDATQQASFFPGLLRIVAEVGTRHTGTTHLGNHGSARAWGEAYFRVRDGPKVRMSVTGTLSWEGSATAWNGHYQALWIANTLRDPSADHINFGFHPLMVEKGASSHAFEERTHWLSPGVYMITWGIHSDGNDARNFDSRVKLNIDVTFGDAETCVDKLGPPARRWPIDAGYSAKVLDVKGKGIQRPYSDTQSGSKVEWEQEQVDFFIEKDGLRKGPYIGWRYVPGTLRRDKDYPLSCAEIDVRYNCHGYTLAESQLWIAQEAVDRILDDWCGDPLPREPGEWHAGDLRLFRHPPFTGVNPIAASLWGVPWFYHEPDHSGMLSKAPGVVDEKLGFLTYERPERFKDWTRTTEMPEYYRCRF